MTRLPRLIYLPLVALLFFSLIAHAQFPGATREKLADPGKHGWSLEKLKAARDHTATLDTEAVMIVVGGRVLGKWGATDQRFIVHSIRKSFISALYGIHILEGRIKMEATMAELGIDDNAPSLSHNGLNEHKIEQLALIESADVAAWGEFIRKLKETPEGDGTLLDHTMVLLTANLGNASAHDNKNMPVIFASGGFRHGQHLAFDQKKNEALPKLDVSALQRLGLETGKFSNTTGTMPGLELV